jgi:hypothetical protein
MSPLRREYFLLLGLLNPIMRIAAVNTASIVSDTGGVVDCAGSCSFVEICVVSYDHVVSCIPLAQEITDSLPAPIERPLYSGPRKVKRIT